MRRRRWLGPALGLALLALPVAVAGGCNAENALVGGECAPTFTACDGRCVDLLRDPAACGACGVVCPPGVACSGGACGGLDGAVDGGLDGAPGDGAPGDGAPGDGAPGDGAPGDGAPGDACVPPFNTPLACGDCFTVCVAPNSRCLANEAGALTCQPPCVAPLVECNNTCVDTQTDPFNCGACGKFCPSNDCQGGVCQGSTPGDIVLIGHDYRGAVAASSQAKVLTNSVFIPRSNPLRVLSYEQFAEAAAVASVKSIIAAAALGRGISYTVANDPLALQSNALSASFDVVLVYDQQGADAATLTPIGAAWQPFLQTFAKAGGVIVALDGNAGMGAMPSLVTAAGLIDIPAHASLANGARVQIVAPFDRVGTLVVSPYATAPRSVSFTSNEANGGNVVWVARHLQGGAPQDPVVIHKIVP